MLSVVRVGALLLLGAILASCQKPSTTNPYAWVRLPGYVDVLGCALSADETIVAAGAWGDVVRVWPDGSQTTLLESKHYSLVAVEGDYAYLGSGPPHDLYPLVRVPLAGGPFEVLGASEGISGLAVDATAVYWIDAGLGGGVYRQLLPGGPTELLYASDEIWGRLVSDETNLYWISLQGVETISKSGGTATNVMPVEVLAGISEGQLWVIAVDDTNIYAGVAPSYLETGAILRTAKGGGSVDLVVSVAYSVTTLSIAGEYLYWADGPSNDFVDYPGEMNIHRWPLMGGEIESLAPSQNGVVAILPTANAVYWCESIPNDIAMTSL